MGVALLCAAAQAVIVEDHDEIGSGPYSFQVALIADPHNQYDLLRAAKDEINCLVTDPYNNIQMVIVLGDLTSTADTTNDFPVAKRILDSLEVPYVPLIGNHDMVPYWYNPPVPGRDADSLFTTRYFEKTFGPVYDSLEAGTYPFIDGFRRYKERPWNFEIQYDTFWAYDIWQNFSFRAGPESSPYRFVCLDFNSRHKTPSWQEGMWPDGDLHNLPFDNRTSSIKVRGGTGMVKCRVYENDSFTGPNCDITCDSPDLGSWKGRISSVWVAEGCTVDLYESVSYEGHVWLRLTADDPDLNINGSAQWWRDYVKAYCDSVFGETHKENVIFFAHHPLMAWPGSEGYNFAGPERDEIAGFLSTYAGDVGGWYAGHLNGPDWYVPLVPKRGRVKYPDVFGSTICQYHIVPSNAMDSGYVKILTLYYDHAGPGPLVDWDGSGPERETVDVTRVDTIPIIVKTLRLGSLTARIQKGGQRICTLVEDMAVSGPLTCTLAWNGRDSSGILALPGDDYSVRYTEDGVFMGSSPFTVKGTCLPAYTATSDTWDTLHEPYVLAGHNFHVDSGASLTIDHGVRVMFRDLTRAGPDIYGIYVEKNCRIEALGTAQDSVYFMPHRKMAVVSSPQDSGWWGELHLEGQSYGATFSHCVFENGGGNAKHQAVLFAHSPDSSRIEVSNCHFLGAMCHAISDTGTARNLIDIDSCVFENGGGFPLYVVKAPDVGRVSANSIFLRNGYNNAYNGMLVEADGDIDTADTWHNCDTTGAGFFYQIADGGDLYIESELHIDPGVKLCLGSKNHIITQNGGSRACPLLS